MARHGKNPETADRLPAEADVYGLNVSEMLLPVEGHRVAFLRRLHERFLGAAAPADRRGRHRRPGDARLPGIPLPHRALFVAPRPGGAGRRRPGLPQPRRRPARNHRRLRIAVRLLRLADDPLLRPTEHLRRLLRAGRAVPPRAAVARPLRQGPADRGGLRRRPAGAAGPRRLRPDFRRTSSRPTPRRASRPSRTPTSAGGSRPRCRQVQAFTRCLTSPSRNAPVVNLADYELLRPAFYTRTLRWSYGAMKGREGSAWQADLATWPLPDALERLAFAGFGGVYLDRAGFADSGAATEAELSRLLGVQPLVSRSGRQTFFDMTAYVREFRGRFTDEEWEAKRESALHPVDVRMEGPRPILRPRTGRRRQGRGVVLVQRPIARPKLRKSSAARGAENESRGVAGGAGPSPCAGRSHEPGMDADAGTSAAGTGHARPAGGPRPHLLLRRPPPGGAGRPAQIIYSMEGFECEAGD